MTHINSLASYLAQAQAWQQNTSSAQGSSATSDANLLQMIESFLSQGVSASASTPNAGKAGGGICCGASSSTSSLSMQNVLQAMTGQSSSNASGSGGAQNASASAAANAQPQVTVETNADGSTITITTYANGTTTTTTTPPTVAQNQIQGQPHRQHDHMHGKGAGVTSLASNRAVTDTGNAAQTNLNAMA